MNFGVDYKVDPESITNAEQAEIYIAFLFSEIKRHYDDIYNTMDRINVESFRFGLDKDEIEAKYFSPTSIYDKLPNNKVKK